MRDLHFDDMHLFARVAELGMLSAVARERDVPVRQVSVVARQIGSLGHRLPKIKACIDYWAEWFASTAPSRRSPRK